MNKFCSVFCRSRITGTCIRAGRQFSGPFFTSRYRREPVRRRGVEGVPASREVHPGMESAKKGAKDDGVHDGKRMSRSQPQPPSKLQTIIQQNGLDGWDKCWEEEFTPWDLGKPTPLVVHLVQNGSLPKGRGLVPGCGSGYDVVALASADRFIVGLDISEKAISHAKGLFSSATNFDKFTFTIADFFNWRPTELFDFIFDYTFFCGIELSMRSAWAKRMHELLRVDGELITLMFPVDDHIGGPPFKVSVTDYEEVLHPFGFKAITIEENKLAVKPRKGREILGRWRRTAYPSRM
ncbi:unnamed protein product [Victoria cruziana]